MDADNKAYKFACKLYEIYNCFLKPGIDRTRLAHWFNEIELSGFSAFATIRRTFEIHHDTIINYFKGRGTNAAAESFNAKKKLQKTV